MQISSHLCQECHTPLEVRTNEKEEEKLALINESFIVLPKKNSNLESSVSDLSNAFQQVQRDSRTKLLQDNVVKVNCPICVECFDKIFKMIDGQIAAAQKENELYSKRLLQLESQIREVQSQQTVNIEELKEDEQVNIQKLQEIADTQAKYQAEIKHLQGQIDLLSNAETAYWKEINDFERKLFNIEEESAKVESSKDTVQKNYFHLMQFNILEQIFPIDSDKEIATICGFKLGRMPFEETKWEEINAAIGQVCLLFCCLANRFNYNFEKQEKHLSFSQKYELTPMGNYSTIGYFDVKGKRIFELYMPSSEARFNNGMRALFDLTQKFCDHVMTILDKNNITENAQPPYRINNGTIINPKFANVVYEVVYSESRMKDWTRSCKHFLTIMKWLIYASTILESKDL